VNKTSNSVGPPAYFLQFRKAISHTTLPGISYSYPNGYPNTMSTNPFSTTKPSARSKDIERKGELSLVLLVERAVVAESESCQVEQALNPGASKQDIKWEKERRRKSNKSRKAKKKYKKDDQVDDEADAN
jgi:hypothetical protein